jgi:acetaldehyde dehydrogenase (acetylating)
MQFGLEKPVFRILVNTFGTLGATGYSTGVMPSMTLGPGGIGGAITGDNINVHNLYNIKRLAYEINVPPEAAFLPGSTDDIAQRRTYTSGAPTTVASTSAGVNDPQIDEIVRRVLAELKK